MPKKENVTLYVYRNKTEKIQEYEIEITKFISEDFVEQEEEFQIKVGPQEKNVQLIVKSFKIKAKLIVSQEKQKTTPKTGPRKESNTEEELPTMNMLKYAT